MAEELPVLPNLGGRQLGFAPDVCRALTEMQSQAHCGQGRVGELTSSERGTLPECRQDHLHVWREREKE